MTNGRGFIALAAMIMGRWTPIGAFASALLFATFLQLGQLHQHRPAGRRPRVAMGAIPAQFFDAIPYILTIVIWRAWSAGASRRRPTACRTSASPRRRIAGRAGRRAGAPRLNSTRRIPVRDRPRHAGRARNYAPADAAFIADPYPAFARFAGGSPGGLRPGHPTSGWSPGSRTSTHCSGIGTWGARTCTWRPTRGTGGRRLRRGRRRSRRASASSSSTWSRPTTPGCAAWSPQRSRRGRWRACVRA